MRVALSATEGILCFVSSPDQGDQCPLVGESTGIRAARARSQVYLIRRDLSGAEVADLDGELPFLSVLVTSACFRRVRLTHREDVRTERVKIAQCRISDHRVVST